MEGTPLWLERLDLDSNCKLVLLPCMKNVYQNFEWKWAHIVGKESNYNRNFLPRYALINLECVG